MIQVTNPDEVTVETVMAKLKAAGGANYGGGAGFSGVKSKAFSSYSEKEKESNIGPVTYAVGTPTAVIDKI
jgi:hypothetical protein